MDMSKTPYEMITEYVKVLSRDPQSKIFAPLSQAYRDNGQFKEAEQVARIGIQRHPEYYGGYMALARVLMDQDRYEEALEQLRKVSEMSPENVLCYELMGQAYLKLEHPKESLKSHKMALFLNPLSSQSRKVIEKLEVITADDYESDVFEMRPPATSNSESFSGPLWNGMPFERTLSLLDAFVVRNEVQKAFEIFQGLQKRFPMHPEVMKRRDLFHWGEKSQDIEPIEKLDSRKNHLQDLKIKKLQKILQVLQKRVDINA